MKSGRTATVLAWFLGGTFIVMGIAEVAVRVLSDEPISRRLESAMIGRDREMALLRQAMDRVAADHVCHLFTQPL